MYDICIYVYIAIAKNIHFDLIFVNDLEEKKENLNYDYTNEIYSVEPLIYNFQELANKIEAYEEKEIKNRISMNKLLSNEDFITTKIPIASLFPKVVNHTLICKELLSNILITSTLSLKAHVIVITIYFKFPFDVFFALNQLRENIKPKLENAIIKYIHKKFKGSFDQILKHLLIYNFIADKNEITDLFFIKFLDTDFRIKKNVNPYSMNFNFFKNIVNTYDLIFVFNHDRPYYEPNINTKAFYLNSFHIHFQFIIRNLFITESTLKYFINQKIRLIFVVKLIIHVDVENSIFFDFETSVHKTNRLDGIKISNFLQTIICPFLETFKIEFEESNKYENLTFYVYKKIIFYNEFVYINNTELFKNCFAKCSYMKYDEIHITGCKITQKEIDMLVKMTCDHSIIWFCECDFTDFNLNYEAYKSDNWENKQFLFFLFNECNFPSKNENLNIVLGEKLHVNHTMINNHFY